MAESAAGKDGQFEVSGGTDRGELLLALMLRMKSGDPEAMKPFYDLTCRFVFGYAQAILRNREDAEEAMMDAYVTVWKNAHRFDARFGGVLRWLALIVRSRAIDVLRVRQGQGRKVFAATFDQTFDWAAPGVPTYSRLEQQGELHHGWASLDAGQREVLRLAFFEDLSHREIAELLGLPLGTVKTRIRLGLKHLKKSLEKDS